jgi:hypothetical protein
MRTFLALLCIAIVVFTAVAGSVSDHFSEVLAPLWVVLFPVLSLVVLNRRLERTDEQPVALLSLLSTRAPPTLPVLG